MAWDSGLTALGGLLLASGMTSLLLTVQRRSLQARLRELPPDEVARLATRSDDMRYANSPLGTGQIWFVVTVGVSFVSLPALLLLAGPIVVLQLGFHAEPPYPQFLALALGVGAGWFWWSVATTRWRSWATRRGMSAGEVQYHGERASILWPRGHVFERTEWGRWQRKHMRPEDT